MALSQEEINNLDEMWQQTQQNRGQKLQSVENAADAASEGVSTLEQGKGDRLAEVDTRIGQATAGKMGGLNSGGQLAQLRASAAEGAVQKGTLGADLDQQIAAAKKMQADAQGELANEKQAMNKARQADLGLANKARSDALAIANRLWREYPMKDSEDVKGLNRVREMVANALENELMPTLISPEARAAVQAMIDDNRSNEGYQRVIDSLD